MASEEYERLRAVLKPGLAVAEDETMLVREKMTAVHPTDVPADAKVEMCPPRLPSVRFARDTIAIAFQRTMLFIRRSMSRFPGSCCCSERAIVFM